MNSNAKQVVVKRTVTMVTSHAEVPQRSMNWLVFSTQTGGTSTPMDIIDTLASNHLRKQRQT